MFQNHVSDLLLNHIQDNLNVVITKIAVVTGGDINRVYKLQSVDNTYLLKVNHRYTYPDMFLKEHDGLLAIKKTNSIAVPEIILQGDFENDSYLVLQWINVGPGSRDFSITLGRQLAKMHHSSNTQFGYYTDNYMGSLVQSNRWYTSWANFFIEQRLQPMVKMAIDNHELSPADIRGFEILYKKLPDLFDEEPPSLVHGDLWGGNYLIDTDGKPYLIDPAVSYGNREFDIAMTTLFGRFDNAFYEAYHDEFALQHGWKQRLKLWNLYPLLVHVNLFGGSYAQQVRRNLVLYV